MARRSWPVAGIVVLAAIAAIGAAGVTAVAAGSCTVVGAGTADFNGTYAQNGNLGDKPFFEGGFSETAQADRVIFYGKGRWAIGYMQGGSVVSVAYGSDEGGDCPPASGWTTYSGEDPAPTITDIVCGDFGNDQVAGEETEPEHLTCGFQTPLLFDVEAPVLHLVNAYYVDSYYLTIVDGPLHGIIVGDLEDIRIERANGEAVWVAPLTYVPAVAYSGSDALTVAFVDPFHGDSSFAEIVFWVNALGAESSLQLSRGAALMIIPPLGFRYRQGTEDVSIAMADGAPVEVEIVETFVRTLGRSVLDVDTGALAPGDYALSMPLGNGQKIRVSLVIR